MDNINKEERDSVETTKDALTSQDALNTDFNALDPTPAFVRRIRYNKDNNKGYIFTIRNPSHPEQVFISSTSQKTLSRRYIQIRKGLNSNTNPEFKNLYEFIRNECGGDWNGWIIELFETINTGNYEQIKARERDLSRRKGTLNTNYEGERANDIKTDLEKVYCEACDRLINKSTLELHNNSKTHVKMLTAIT
jgi:RNase P subunit RPR2